MYIKSNFMTVPFILSPPLSVNIPTSRARGWLYHYISADIKEGGWIYSVIGIDGDLRYRQEIPYS